MKALLIFMMLLFGFGVSAHQEIEFKCFLQGPQTNTNPEVKLTLKKAFWFWEVDLATVSGFPFEGFKDRLGESELFLSAEKDRPDIFKDDFVYKYDFYPRAFGMSHLQRKVQVALPDSLVKLVEGGRIEFPATFRYYFADTPKNAPAKFHEDFASEYLCIR